MKARRFAGAERERPGRIASAEGGTLFLDEIAEIPRKLQAKLLRFLQSGEIQRLGSDKVEKVDVRVVAATHRSLRSMVRAKKFRQDLYYRLNVLELKIPPLRERRSDIPLLLDHFVRKHWRRANETPTWSAAAEALLRSHGYPGNVRELEHLVERACLLARGPELGVELLPSELSEPPLQAGKTDELLDLSKEGLKSAREAAVGAVERRFLEALLERSGGNVTRAARDSGLHRSQLQRLLAEHRVANADS